MPLQPLLFQVPKAPVTSAQHVLKRVPVDSPNKMFAAKDAKSTQRRKDYFLKTFCAAQANNLSNLRFRMNSG